tara:strand:+ start:361 stop:1269 length:909 start_codon:yes stop_codon:yes gene_type:complete
MAISRAQLAKELEPGLNALFGMEYDRYENETAEIFETESSDRAFEEEVLIIGFGNAEVKTEGQGVNYDTASEGFTARYTHETVALAFALTEEAVEDNLYDRLGSRYTKALARSMAHSKQVKGANVLNNAFSTSYTGGDGLSLVNSAHTLAGGGTFSNRPSTYVDLNETSLENALITVSTFVDDRSLILALQGTKLVVPPQQQFIAERILETPGLPFSADNDVNPIRSMGMVPQGYAVNHFLTDNDAWFLLSDCPDGLKHFERTPISTSMEGDFDTGNVRFKARERYSFGWSNPRAIYGSSGA